MIFKLLGPPTNNSWPDYSGLPLAKTLSLPSPQPPQFRQKFPYLTSAGIDLLMSLLTYDPARRITAEEALHHPYFRLVIGICSFRCHCIIYNLNLKANPHYPSIRIYSGLSHPWQLEKSACISSVACNYIQVKYWDAGDANHLTAHLLQQESRVLIFISSNTTVIHSTNIHSQPLANN